jgi:hypothetical protein
MASSRQKQKRKAPKRIAASHRNTKALTRARKAPAPLAAHRGNQHDEVLRLTNAIFDGDIEFQDVTDPESGVKSVQVAVEAPGDVEELLALNDRWHRELANLGDLRVQYGLSLVPRDEST